MIRKVKIILIKNLCRREKKVAWDWTLSSIGWEDFLHGVQGLWFRASGSFCLVVLCLSSTHCGFESSASGQQKGKKRVEKPTCFLKVLTRSDTDHFCSYSVDQNKSCSHTGQWGVQKYSHWLSSTHSLSPTLDSKTSWQIASYLSY